MTWKHDAFAPHSRDAGPFLPITWLII